MITIRVTRAHPPGWSRGCTITVRPPDVRGSAEVGSGTRARWPAPVDRVRPALPVGVPLYAAYGSNMDPAQMKERAPHSPMAGTGWLMGWRLTFGGEDFAWEGALSTVVEDPTSQVFVVLYDVPEHDAAQ